MTVQSISLFLVTRKRLKTKDTQLIPVLYRCEDYRGK